MKKRFSFSDMAGFHLPNIPTPKNGMIKTYDNSNRTFTRPYSAKTIFFYKKDDEYFQGVRVPVFKARYRTLDSLMDDLSGKVPLYFGVRRLFTPVGGREIQSIDDLNHMGRYVCSSTKWAHRPTELNSARKGLLFRRTRSHDENANIESPQEQESARSLLKTKASPISSLTSPLIKQVTFALNGKPNRIYRMQLKLRRLPEFDDILREVGDGLQTNVWKLFTMEGKRGNLMMIKCSSLISLQTQQQGICYYETNFQYSGKKFEYRTAKEEKNLKALYTVTSVDEIVKGPTQLIACHKYERPNLENGVRLPPVGPLPTKRKLPPLPSTPRKQNSLPDVLEVKDIPTKNVRRRAVSTNKKKKLKKDKSKTEKDEDKQAAEGILLEKCEMEWAAFRLQAAFRALRRWRKLVENSRIARRIQSIDPELANRSAVAIQSKYKAYVQRKKYKKKLEAKTKIDEIDPEIANKAAVKIQSMVRGHHVRKKLKRPQTPVNAFTPVVSNVDFEKQEASAVKIQSNFRGYKQRKKYKEIKEVKRRVDSIDAEILMKAVIKIQAAFRGFAARKKLKNKLAIEKSLDSNENTTDTGKTKYNVLIMNGNRWGAYSEADLYVILCGENGESERIVLKKDNDEKTVYKQNSLESFTFETDTIDGLNAIVLGHSSQGYGAGLFVADVIIKEDCNPGNKIYHFPCLKWFDTGQVDGKIERRLVCRGYQKNNSDEKSDPQTPSSNRFQVTMAFGDIKSSAANAQARVELVCCSARTNSDPICVIDNLSESYANSSHSFTIDANNFGDLIKLRFESINNSDSSGLVWFLKNVILRRVDGDQEEMCLYCNNWFGMPNKIKNSNISKPQMFRELPVIRSNFLLGTALQDYNVSITLSQNLFTANLPLKITFKLHGEFGDSGSCVVEIPSLNQSKVITTSVESVMLGRLSSVSCTIPVTQQGEFVSEGLNAICDIFSKHGVSMTNNYEWLIEKIVVRDNDHTPYQYILSTQRSVSSLSPGFVKRLLFVSDVKGLSTKMTDEVSSIDSKTSGKYTVSLTSGPETAFNRTKSKPSLIIFGENGQTKPFTLSAKGQKILPTSTCHFKVNVTENVGKIDKIRLQLIPSPVPEKPQWNLKSVKLKNDTNGSEAYFPLDVIFKDDDEIFVEAPAAWPDVPPLPMVEYQVSMHTGIQSENNTDFFVSLEIFGNRGDSGKRLLTKPVGTQSESCFKPGNVDTFILKHVALEKIEKITVAVEPKNESASWFLDDVELYDPDGSTLYKFSCKKWFSNAKAEQQLERILTPNEIVEDVESFVA